MNTKNLINQTAVIFAILAIAGVSLAVGSKFVANPSEQTILVGIGSAMFGAALTFFLIRILSIAGK
ncbi:MAG TPA: hypothetical protein VFQ23_09380 [Anaerolineales bacterium]|jgi:hypothetical protein|nr:hypothetical protein [Anaerolineales bacterium]